MASGISGEQKSKSGRKRATALEKAHDAALVRHVGVVLRREEQAMRNRSQIEICDKVIASPSAFEPVRVIVQKWKDWLSGEITRRLKEEDESKLMRMAIATGAIPKVAPRQKSKGSNNPNFGRKPPVRLPKPPPRPVWMADPSALPKAPPGRGGVK